MSTCCIGRPIFFNSVNTQPYAMAAASS
jgi:hypothetical protein